MKAIVYLTGASGHLGRNIAETLLEDPETELVAFAFPNDSHLDYLKPYGDRVSICYGNLLKEEEVEAFVSTKENSPLPRYVIHSAGLISIYKHNDPKVFEVNVNGTKSLLALSKKHGISRFVYVSSVDAIVKPKKPQPVLEPALFDPELVEGVYGKSKAEATAFVLSQNSKDFLTCSVHPSALLGPDDAFGGPINTAIAKFLKGKLKALVNGGYDLVDVRDVAKGIVLALAKGKGGNPYILSGHPIEVKNLIKECARLTGLPSYKIIVPHWLVKAVSPFLEAHAKAHHKKPLFTAYSMDCLNQNSNYSAKKAEDELGYSSRPLEETLKETIEFVKIAPWFESK